MIFKAVCSIPQRERWDHTLKLTVCIFTDWHATGGLVRKPQLYDALGQMLFWHYAYFTVISILNWGAEFAHVCKMQSMKSSGLVALWGQMRLRFACPVVQLIKQLDCFQDSLTPALSFIFLCHYFLRKKKKLISMKLWGGKPVLYMKEKHFFLVSEMHMEILQQVQFV